MTENQKAAILIGGLVSAALCSTGFVNRTQVQQTEKVVAVSTGEMLESVQNLHYIETDRNQVAGIVGMKVGAAQEAEARKAVKRQREREKKASAVSNDRLPLVQW